MRALLNKLTPQNFPTLMGQVVNFEINTEERLAGVIDLIFEKVKYWKRRNVSIGKKKM